MTSTTDATETHISSVFFAGDRAYKLLKPVQLPFVDFSDTEYRLEAARRELELNRRLAPDVYLGLADIFEDDELVDHMIVMRRLPDSERFSTVVSRDPTSDCIRAVAREVARFHSGLDPLTDPDGPASREALRARWADNFTSIEPSVGRLIHQTDFDRAAALVTEYLDSNGELFAKRISGGFARDGHGDLTADDIFCTPDGPRILDCLAFREDFRIGDVLADIAFLVMDLHRLAGADAARSLLRCYQQFSNEAHPASLAHHYVAYRAHVRAKVACISVEQGRSEQGRVARAYHDLALHHLERGQIRLVMIGGAPGVGKSTLARSVNDRFGWPLLVTDEIRKDLAGVDHRASAAAPFEEGIYSPDMTAKAYAEMLREADVLLRAGESVILDASWTHPDHRRLASELAEQRGARLVEIECTLEPKTTRQRILGRSVEDESVSDATIEIAERLSSVRAPWPTAHTLSTAGTVEANCDRIRRLLEGDGRLGLADTPLVS